MTSHQSQGRTETLTCSKCGAVEQEIEVMESAYRWTKDGPPTGEGWSGPLYPHAALKIYKRPKRERVFDCKFICPNTDAGRASLSKTGEAR